MSERFPPDPDPVEIRLPVLTVSQPIGDIYIASVDSDAIQRITYFDVRRVIQSERDIERYLGIQRPLNEHRLSELYSYVNYVDATFPTSIIVALEPDYSFYDPERREVVIRNYREGDPSPSTAVRNVGRVIDGQHRIRGLDQFKKVHSKNFDVVVSFFIGSDIADQAYVFATVNLEQTKVNKSLAYDLFELARSRSPFKTCHNIAVAFDNTEGSPFFKKIKRLGTATVGRDNSETITQATFVNGLIGYISGEPKEDRDRILRGKKLEKVVGSELDKRIFRNMFIDGEDVKIGKIYEAYFGAVAQRWPLAWEYRGTGIILSRTNGYRALASVFGRVYRRITAPGNTVPVGAFLREFEKVDVEWDYFSTDNFKPGSSGEAELRNLLLHKMGLNNV